MKATEDGVLVSWDEVKEILFGLRQGMFHISDGYSAEKRKRPANRSEVMMEILLRDDERVRLMGNALVAAYKEVHPEAEVQYAKPLEEAKV